MEHYDFRFDRRRPPAFDEVPAAAGRRVFGVDYVAVRGAQGGDLFLTRAGWGIAESLRPRLWYDGELFRRIGRALSGGTGTVYHVPVPHPARERFGVVVKFCRFGQDVGLTQVGGAGGLRFPWPDTLLDGAEFLGPFLEFGRVEALRAKLRRSPRFGTMRPLAIYCPAMRHPRWQLGRAPSRDWQHDRPLAADQAGAGANAVRHDWERLYILLYQWIEGIDAEEAVGAGLLDREAMIALARTAAEDLAALGFAVLDHKPRHVILRPRRSGGGLLRRGGRPVYALIDYELLVPFGPPG